MIFVIVVIFIVERNSNCNDGAFNTFADKKLWRFSLNFPLEQQKPHNLDHCKCFSTNYSLLFCYFFVKFSICSLSLYFLPFQQYGICLNNFALIWQLLLQTFGKLLPVKA